jgi:hypothetical protein
MRALGKGSVATFIKVALDVSWVILWVAALFLVIGAVAYGFVLVGMAAGWLPHDMLEAGERVTHVGPITISTDTEGELFLPAFIPALLAGAVAVTGSLIIVLRLKQLFRSLTSGEPFSRDNAVHLRVIWITMLVMELSRYAIWTAITVGVAVFGQPERSEIHVDSPVNLMTWGSILILIVLAEVFREGARLKEEQELTI